MPLVSDPGFPLVQGCVAAGLAVEVLPGPSLGDDRAGGERAADRRLALRRLPAAQARAAARPSSRSPETLVAFESPRRVGASLAVLAELDPERPVAVCRELTKLHEEIVRGSAAELAARYAAEPPRGEIVLVVGGAPAPTGADPAAIEAVRSWSSPAPAPRPPRRSSPSSPARPANALYRAVAT